MLTYLKVTEVAESSVAVSALVKIFFLFTIFIYFHIFTFFFDWFFIIRWSWVTKTLIRFFHFSLSFKFFQFDSKFDCYFKVYDDTKTIKQILSIWNVANVTLAARQLIKPRAFAAIDLARVQLDLNNVSQYTLGDLKLATFQFKPERKLKNLPCCFELCFHFDSLVFWHWGMSAAMTSLTHFV